MNYYTSYIQRSAQFLFSECAHCFELEIDYTQLNVLIGNQINPGIKCYDTTWRQLARETIYCYRGFKSLWILSVVFAFISPFGHLQM